MQTALGAQSSSNQTKLIIFGAICISLLMSWLSIINNHVLSSDSLLYIFTAQTFLDHGLNAAVESYPWPLLSILIATVHKLTGLSLVMSGHILTSIIYAGICSTFVLLIKDLGGTARIQLLALGVIIFFPTLNDYRDYITRDPGFWLFILLSIQQLLRYVRHNGLRHALCWFLFTILAIGFRTEAIFFLLLSPISLLADKQLTLKQRIQKIIILYAAPLCLGLLGTLIVFATPQLSAELRLITEISNVTSFFSSLTEAYEQTIASFTDIIPSKHRAKDMGVIFGTGLIGLVIYSLIHTLTLPYIALLGWPKKSSFFPDSSSQRYLLAYFLIIVFYLLLLSFKKYFLTDRFCVMAALVLMLAIPFSIEKIWSASKRTYDWRRLLVTLLLLTTALDSLINSRSSKEYIVNAADWVKEHIPPKEPLLTNHKQIAALGANCWSECLILNTNQLIENAEKAKPEFLVIQLKKKDTQAIQKANNLVSKTWSVLKKFENEQGDQVIIFKAKRSHIE